MMKILTILLSILFLFACFGNDNQLKNSIKLGEATFEKHCQACHGKAGQGIVKNWKKRLPNGNYPPPPLNGTAHTWHHSPKVLLRTINDGGVRLGGVMPGFRDKLNNKQKQGLIDYMYSLWPEDIKRRYDKKFK